MSQYLSFSLLCWREILLSLHLADLHWHNSILATIVTCLVCIYSRTPGVLCVFKDVFVQKFQTVPLFTVLHWQPKAPRPEKKSRRKSQNRNKMDDNWKELRTDSRLPAIKFPKEFIEVRPCSRRMYWPTQAKPETNSTNMKMRKDTFFYKNRKPNIHKRKDRQPLSKDTQYNPRNCKFKD